MSKQTKSFNAEYILTLMKNIRMNYLLLISLVFIPAIGISQDTTYYTASWVKTEKNNAAYFKTLDTDQQNQDKGVEKYFFKDGQLMLETHYSSLSNKTIDGKRKEWNKNGQLLKDIDFKNGKYDGYLRTYWENGQLKREDIFIEGKLQSGKCYNSDGKEAVHFDYEIMPEFPGGYNALMQYLVSELKYPKKARKKKVQGKVLINFIVEKDGSVSNITLKNSVDPELDKEAIRVVKAMPKWKPALQDGEKIKIRYSLPITFKLPE